MRAYGEPMHPHLKLALNFGPLLIFFVANTMLGIFTATAVFMAVMLIVLAIEFAAERKVSVMPLITTALVLVFGGLTLWLSNDIFIKMLFGQIFSLSDPAWRSLTWRWSLFFIALAIMNEIVWRHFSTNIWVAFKVWGVFPLT